MTGTYQVWHQAASLSLPMVEAFSSDVSILPLVLLDFRKHIRMNGFRIMDKTPLARLPANHLAIRKSAFGGAP